MPSAALLYPPPYCTPSTAAAAAHAAASSGSSDSMPAAAPNGTSTSPVTKAMESQPGVPAAKGGVPVIINQIGSMICLFFTDQPVHNLADAMCADRERFKKYFHGMLAEGIYFAPSAFEAGFISAAHTDEDIDATTAAAGKVMAKL